MDGDSAPDLNLGDPVDLWAGLKPRFPSADLPWRVPRGRPVRIERPSVPEGPVEWDPPSLSLHDDVADLLGHIFDYAVCPMVGLDGPHSVTAGELMVAGSLAELESRLKLDLTIRPAPAYLLVRLTGSRGTAYFTPEWLGLNRKSRIVEWLTPEGRNAMARLRLRAMRQEGHELYGDVTARQARRYVEHFHDMGTHVVRSIRYGERLFQVFEANGDLLPGLREGFAREAGVSQVRGPMVLGMAHLTRRPWVTRASPILSASGSEAASRVADHEIWTSAGAGEPPSLLAPGAMTEWSRTAVLDGLPARSIVEVSFASQSLYLEDHRADAWTRIMRAGLCQRFPAVVRSGWRERGQFPLAAFLAGAALEGEEALCKPAAPVLPDIAFVLDLAAPGRTARAPADCLAFFAATHPGAGRAARLEIADPAFDPAGLKIPFLDGALCITDGEGERSCLVEGVLLGRAEEGRPGIVGAPAEPGAAALARHAPLLAAYASLMGKLQGRGVPLALAAAMRRSASWLAEVTAQHPGLAPLRWQALQIARGAGQGEFAAIVLDGGSGKALAGLLRSGVDLLALPSDSPDLGAAATLLDGRIRAFYAALPGVPEASELDRESLAAGEALQRRFAGFARAPDLPGQAAALFAAGAALCLPPDPRRMPHALVPGDEPYAMLWNALFALRARYSECRAIALAMQGRTGEAADLLAGEIIGRGDGPPDPAVEMLAALDRLSGELPHIGAKDRDGLLADMAELLERSRSARLLHLAIGGGPESAAETGPQLRRLLIVLELLRLCRAVNIPLPPLDSLAPAALAALIGRALAATAAPLPAA